MRAETLLAGQRKRIPAAAIRVGGWRDATRRRCRCRFTCRFSFAASRHQRKVSAPLTPQARRACGSSMSELPPPHRDALSRVFTPTPHPPTAQPSPPPPKARVSRPHHPQASCLPEVDEEEEKEEQEEEEEEEGNWKEKFHDNMSINSLNDSGARTPLCRICFQGPEQGELLSPCRCSGSVRCSHEPCLVKWISERGSWSCEICYYKYHVVSISTKNPLQWRSITLTVIERVQIAAAVLGSLFLLASISWLVWSSLSPNARWQRQDLLFQICYAMYGFMDLVCIVLIVHEGPSVFRIFHRWQAVNQRWKVLNYDKARDLAEQQKPDSPPRRQPPLPAPGPTPAPPPPHGLAGTSPSLRSSALLAAVAMTMTPADPGTTSSPDQEEEEEEEDQEEEEEEEEQGEEDTEEVQVPPMVMGVTSGSERARAAPGPGENHGDGGDGAGYRWTYSMLHLLGQRGGPGPPLALPQGPRDPNRELVMRVTSL